MPLVHVHATFTPRRMIASQTFAAHSLSEVKMSSTSTTSRNPRVCKRASSSAHRSGDFFRYPRPIVFFEPQKSHLNTHPRENSIVLTGLNRAISRVTFRLPSGG